ncbi:MAG: hypothetical protein ACI8T1_001011 [Verrucomicrobiales bacterium]|jgi:hypothetical protein
MTPTEICQNLGYTEAWISLGVIDEAGLQEQWSIYTNSDDKNAEHYRCGVVRDFLTQKESFTDEEILTLPEFGYDANRKR